MNWKVRLIFLCSLCNLVAYRLAYRLWPEVQDLDPNIASLTSENRLSETWKSACEKAYTAAGLKSASCPSGKITANSYFSEESVYFRSLAQVDSAKVPGNKLNFLRLQQLLQRLYKIRLQFMNNPTSEAWNSTDAIETVNILVIGGSLTAGRMVGGFKGAWSTKLKKLLGDDYPPTIHFNIINIGVYATNLLWAINRWNSLIPHDIPIDLIVVDYDVNDGHGSTDTTESRLWHQAVTEVFIYKVLNMNHLAFHRNITKTTFPINKNTEKHSIQDEFLPGPAMIFLSVSVNNNGRRIHGDCSIYGTSYSIGDVRYTITSHYSIPVLSQRYAIWPNISCDPPTNYWPCSTFCSHPVHNAHWLLAKIVQRFLSGVAYAFSPSQYWTTLPTSLDTLEKNWHKVGGSLYSSNSTIIASESALNTTSGVWFAIPNTHYHPYIQQYLSQHMHQQYENIPAHAITSKEVKLSTSEELIRLCCDEFRMLYDSLKMIGGLSYHNNSHNNNNSSRNGVVSNKEDSFVRMNKMYSMNLKDEEGSSNSFHHSLSLYAKVNLYFQSTIFYKTYNNIHPLFHNKEHHNESILSAEWDIQDPLKSQFKNTFISQHENSPHYFHNFSHNNIPFLFHYQTNANCWNIEEDVIGKPGWLAIECDEESIIFLVTFGQYPILSVSYLSTYTNNTGMIQLLISKHPVNCQPSLFTSTVDLIKQQQETGHAYEEQQKKKYCDFEALSEELSLKQKQAGKANLPQDEFMSMGFIDAGRTKNDWFTTSTQEVSVFLPDDDRKTNHITNMKEFYVDEALMLPYSTYFVMIKQVNAEKEEYRKHQTSNSIGTREEVQKFKLYSLSSC